MRNIFTVILLFIGTSLMAQTSRLSDHNKIGWYNFIGTIAVNNKISIHTEYQYRRTGWITNWQQSLLRAGINYKVHKQVTLTLGYAWTLTYPYGDHTVAGVPKTFPEHRIYEQVVVSTPIDNVLLSHRFRLEQRLIGRFTSLASTSPDQWVYLNRIRYMPRVEVPIYKNLSAVAYDELCIGFGKHIGENIFDQNRISAQLLYKFNNHLKLEAGYINQTLQLGREIAGKNVIQYNNGIIATLYLNI